jgi:hypothetical protein
MLNIPGTKPILRLLWLDVSENCLLATRKDGFFENFNILSISIEHNEHEINHTTAFEIFKREI